MGDQFTLADLNLATFIARLDGLALLGPWLVDRPNAKEWWSRIKSRPSYAEAEVGPSGEESETMNTEGMKVLGDFEEKRAEYIAQYGSK